MVAHARGVLWMGGRVFLEQNPMSTWGFLDGLMFGISMLTRLAVEFVIIFFVLSGFSIAYSLRNKQKSLLFYLKRVVRIYPPYILALLWAAVILIITKALNPSFFTGVYNTLVYDRYAEMNTFFEYKTILKNLTYIPSGGFIETFWSLSHEIIFYILAPLLVLKRSIYYVISIILYCTGLFFSDFVSTLNIHYILKDFLFTYNFYFMMGISLFWNFNPLLSFMEKIGKSKSFILLIIMLLLTFSTNIYFKTSSIVSFTFASVFAVILILYFISFNVNISFLKKIGKYSYTLYITHLATIFLYHSLYFYFFNPENMYIENFLVFIPAIFLSLIVAYLFYLLVEKNTKSILKKLRQL